MQVVRIGLDLAKYVFEVHGIDADGNVVVRKTLRRGSVSTFFANLPRRSVGMELLTCALLATVLQVSVTRCA